MTKEHASRAFTCKGCHILYHEDDVDEPESNFGTGLCQHCFQDGVEEAEERRRERIARENEY